MQGLVTVKIKRQFNELMQLTSGEHSLPRAKAYAAWIKGIQYISF